MDALSLIVGALAYGAGAGLGETAGQAVQDAYSTLKRLLARRFRGNPAAQVALAEHAADPETWRARLEKELARSGATADREVIAAAQQVMALLDKAGAVAGKYRVEIHHGQGIQIGDHDYQVNVFTTPPAP